ncbi:hypothetical protein GQ42DRAFT_47329 [Ramicandelaber brevisporus]|nr:hypothetical protein GQ42DRAFT_47329 [Ramicandelaber brevisporus]
MTSHLPDHTEPTLTLIGCSRLNISRVACSHACCARKTLILPCYDGYTASLYRHIARIFLSLSFYSTSLRFASAMLWIVCACVCRVVC